MKMKRQRIALARITGHAEEIKGKQYTYIRARPPRQYMHLAMGRYSTTCRWCFGLKLQLSARGGQPVFLTVQAE